ncbi:MAG TPA: purine-nucleoside phosphorylase, partial [Chloroflexota bacterium]
MTEVVRSNTYDQLEESAHEIRRHSPVRPQIGIVLGSGLGALTAEATDAVHIPYREIPHFPISTVVGHAGELVLGEFQGKAIAMMSGRVHAYEGYSAQQVVFPVRLLHTLGVRRLIVTNAAGGVNPIFAPGTLMLIADHINLTGQSPLIGPNDERFGPRFPDMSEAYPRQLRALARRAALRAGVEV